jgi:hypothetical protein
VLVWLQMYVKAEHWLSVLHVPDISFKHAVSAPLSNHQEQFILAVTSINYWDYVALNEMHEDHQEWWWEVTSILATAWFKAA